MKNYKVITPAGDIYVETAKEAIEYQKLYGYLYVRINNDEKTKDWKPKGIRQKI